MLTLSLRRLPLQAMEEPRRRLQRPPRAMLGPTRAAARWPSAGWSPASRQPRCSWGPTLCTWAPTRCTWVRPGSALPLLSRDKGDQAASARLTEPQPCTPRRCCGAAGTSPLIGSFFNRDRDKGGSATAPCTTPHSPTRHDLETVGAEGRSRWLALRAAGCCVSRGLRACRGRTA